MSTTSSEAPPVDAPGAPRRRLHGIAVPVLAFVAVALVLHLVVWQSAQHLPGQEAGRFCANEPSGPTLPCGRARVAHGDDILGAWLYYDSGWYLAIARNGYSPDQLIAFKQGQQSAVAFFPAYPMVVRAFGVVVDDSSVAAMLVTFLFGLATAVLFWTWCRRRLPPRARLVALGLLLLYPYAWFLYGTGYADAFFLCFVLAAFVALDEGHPVVAGLLGAVATAARPTGPALIIGLAAVALDRAGAVTREEGLRFRFDRSNLRPGDFGVLLSAGGLVAWMGFLWAKTGDALAFLTVQSAPGWNQGAGFNTWLKRSFLGQLYHHDSPSFAARLLLQALFVLLFLVVVPLVGRRFGWGYAAYSLAMILIPVLGTSDFQGTGRYLLAVFPVFAVGGAELATRPRAAVGALASFGVALVALSALFATGLYLT